MSFAQGPLLGLVVALAAVGALGRRRAAHAPQPRREIVAAEVLFWGVFLFFLVVRAFNPEVFWGEKPMDFAFLNALTRATTLPPPEPWFAGSPLHYNYFGHYIVAALGKAVHLQPAITFNLAIALFGALTAAAAFAAGSAITGRWGTGLLAACLVTLAGNLAGVREALSRRTFNFDYFWATSRVIKDTINEFPLWSFLFADLHAHVMVMPLTLTFIALVVLWVRARVIGVRRRAPAGQRAGAVRPALSGARRHHGDQHVEHAGVRAVVAVPRRDVVAHRGRVPRGAAVRGRLRGARRRVDGGRGRRRVRAVLAVLAQLRTAGAQLRVGARCARPPTTS